MDSPSILAKLNFWLYINIRIFKVKLSNYITYMISSLNNMKFKDIKIYYNIYDFEFIFYKFFQMFIFIYLFSFFII